MVVYASPPLSGVNSQLFAKCGYLWPSSFLSSLPLSTSHSRIVLSLDPLTSCDGFVGLKSTEKTQPLPLSQMSALLVTSLRLSPADRGKHATLRKMQPPVALERLQALACARVPELHRHVQARTGEQPVNRPRHSQDRIAAIFLTCQFN
jgi:hypothetical protein